MDLVIAFALFIAAMVLALVLNINMIFPLLVGLICFTAVGLHRGFAPKALGSMIWDGAKSSFVVLRIFALIGLITGLWRSAGTISFFVYYGIRMITPPLFIFIAFWLTCALSYALGTSFGITGTVGIILMALARSGGVNELITAGAILSGAYFGDRCAPASSCANLVANVTATKLYDNVHLMLKTGALPFLLTSAMYLWWSVQNPISGVDTTMLTLLEQNFNLSLWCVLPAALMILLPLLKVEVRTAMLLSIGSAFLVTVFCQGIGIREALGICIFGFSPSGSLARILAGGGMLSMLDVVFIVMLSSTYSGVFNGTGMLHGMERLLTRAVKRLQLFPTMVLVSFFTAGVFCNQTIAVILNAQLMQKVYEADGASPQELAQDIANSVVTISGIVPWTIACTVPLGMLGVPVLPTLPYCVLLYAIPLCYGLTKKRWFGTPKNK